jgi:hypothetical protein
MSFGKKPQMTSTEFNTALREAGFDIDHGRIRGRKASDAATKDDLHRSNLAASRFSRRNLCVPATEI